MAEELRNSVIIVGCGPGLKSYITPKALYNIKKADILVGSRRLLKLFPDTTAKRIILEKNYKQLLKKIASWSFTRQVVVLVSGDPCFFSYTKLIVKKFGRESCIIIPGLSSIQLAFAAIGESWEDAGFASVHGRSSGYKELIKKVKDYDKVAVLTDKVNTPARIAGKLAEAGIRKRQMFICENLSLPNESVHETDIQSAMKLEANGSSVVIIKKNE
ncbi:MAG: precorrin-6y C5,15-methyltransferase (decarboxylating) subunit CbiE [Candidatus Kuenenia sp.]|nr:precorrin-6y C5,15-methyltransferase (decarboxylating) subunit CbiE [Candidatus Kuenenia hertensis]